MGQCFGKVEEVGNGMLGCLVQADLVLVAAGECHLELGEEPFRARYSENHASEFTKQFVGLLDADAVFAVDLVQDGEQAFKAVWRQFQGAG
ncbi:hypothetical protein ACA910_019464 [Epithemia clementina (nom. ined.)]